MKFRLTGYTGITFRYVIYVVFTLFAANMQQVSADISDPTPLFSATMHVLHSFTNSAYATYRMHLHISLPRKVEDDYFYIEERTADHFGRVRSLSANGSPTDSVNLTSLVITPDYLLLPHRNDMIAGLEPDPQGLRTVASVEAVNYNVAILEDHVDIDACRNTRHLVLTPKADSSRFRLRELWIEANDHICHAKISDDVYIGDRREVIVEASVDPDSELITAFSFTGSGRLKGMLQQVSVSGYFTDVQSANLSESLFTK